MKKTVKKNMTKAQNGYSVMDKLGTRAMATLIKGARGFVGSGAPEAPAWQQNILKNDANLAKNRANAAKVAANKEKNEINKIKMSAKKNKLSYAKGGPVKPAAKKGGVIKSKKK